MTPISRASRNALVAGLGHSQTNVCTKHSALQLPRRKGEEDTNVDPATALGDDALEEF